MSVVGLYCELRGKLAPTGPRPPLDTPLVVWSSLTHGNAQGAPVNALLIKHVVKGEPVQHVIGSRRYRVGPGQFICIPPHSASEAEIRQAGTVTDPVAGGH